jgi:uncharacterized membrane protein YfcA
MHWFSPGIAVALLAAGLFVGVVSGMVGIGGGILVIPILMIGFGFSQPRANGTSMAMLLPPIGIFAVMNYWRSGNVNLPFAAMLAIGFAAGAYFGAALVNSGRINPTVLRVIFAVLLLYVAGRILFRTGGRARATLETLILMGIFVGNYFLMRLIAPRLQRSPRWREDYRKRLEKPPADHDYEI